MPPGRFRTATRSISSLPSRAAERRRHAKQHGSLRPVVRRTSGGRASSCRARPADGRLATARHTVRSRRRRGVVGWPSTGHRRRPSRLPGLSLPLHPAPGPPGPERCGHRGRPHLVSLHLFAHHRDRRSDALRPVARQRAARAPAGHAEQHRRRGHHHRSRRASDVRQSRGGDLDGMGAAGCHRPTPRHGVSNRQRRNSRAGHQPDEEGPSGGHRGRPGEPHRLDQEGWQRTSDRRQCGADPGRERRHLRVRADFPGRHRAATDGAGEREPAPDRSSARVDRRILGRRHHRQVAQRHHPELERGRRAALRLHRGAGGRPPHLSGHSRGAHRGGRPDHRQSEGRQTHRALRDRACALRRRAHPGLSHHLADQGRHGQRRRCVQDRARCHRNADGRGARAPVVGASRRGEREVPRLLRTRRGVRRDHGPQRHHSRGESSVLGRLRLYPRPDRREAVLGGSLVGAFREIGRAHQGGIGPSSHGRDVSRGDALLRRRWERAHGGRHHPAHPGRAGPRDLPSPDRGRHHRPQAGRVRPRSIGRQPAPSRERAIRSRSPQGRVPGDAGTRAPKSPSADEQRRAGSPARRAATARQCTRRPRC